MTEKTGSTRRGTPTLDDELTDELYAIIGWRITRLRKTRGIRQQTLADAIGVTHSSIANAEVGRQRLPLDKLLAIAQSLGTTLPELLDTERELPTLIEPLPAETFSAMTDAVARLEEAQAAIEKATIALNVLTEGNRPA